MRFLKVNRKYQIFKIDTITMDFISVEFYLWVHKAKYKMLLIDNLILLTKPKFEYKHEDLNSEFYIIY